MRFTIGLIASAGLLGAALAAFGARAEDPIPTIQIPDEYRLGSLPDGVMKPPAPQTAAAPRTSAAPAAAGFETASAINGTNNYAVIAPTYTGTTSSFIRLFNGGSTAASFSVTVVGATTGTNYGTGVIVVPTRSSPQFTMTEIRSKANVSASATDTTFSLYIQSAEPTAGYQHVTFNGNNFFFENSSVCAHLLNEAIAPVVASVALINVHTSSLAGNQFPSQIDIHNYFNAAINYKFTIADAANGTVVGQTNVATAPNTSYSMPFSFFENAINWHPTSAQPHANIIVTDPSGAAPAVVLGLSITNNQLTAKINMTTACSVNAPTTASVGGGGGFTGIGY
ncbi:MAG: hypothetical protein EXQ84_05900 [Rhodospirillaceae bacterium]|nr:hypothetical protein [Rhodospirillaceae bacterium]